MASEGALRRANFVLAYAAAAAALIVPAAALAQQPAARASIYSCIGADGKRIRSDRPIAECMGKEQQELNSDGSVRRVIAPPPTADELAEREARERQAKADVVARNDAIRRDRNLMQRFPDEARHHKAREKALDDLRASVKNSEGRIALLKLERKPLEDEKEFYVGKPLPDKLKRALDANDAALEAQRSLMQNQQLELGRINALFDAELVRLKKLWSGAPAGSLGPTPAPAAAPRPEARASSSSATETTRPARIGQQTATATTARTSVQ